MQYLMLIYKDQEKLAAAGPEAQAALGKAYGEFNTFLAESGALRGTATWPAGITSVRLRDGETRTSEAPYSEGSDAVGGFFLIDVDDVETAIKFAEHVPDALYGAVEIRPVQPGQ